MAGDDQRLRRKTAVKSKSFSAYKDRQRRECDRSATVCDMFDPVVTNNDVVEGDDSLIDLTSHKPVLNSQQNSIVYGGTTHQGLSGVSFTTPDYLHPPPPHTHCVAIVRYLPVHADELSLLPGDIIQPLGQLEPGWWAGRVKLSHTKRAGIIGVFPSNFVRYFYIDS